MTDSKLSPFDDDVALGGPDAPKARNIDDLTRYCLTVRERFGNTCVSFSLQWGSVGMGALSAERQHIAELEATPEVAHVLGKHTDANPECAMCVQDAKVERLRTENALQLSFMNPKEKGELIRMAGMADQIKRLRDIIDYIVEETGEAIEGYPLEDRDAKETGE